jgi:hypothetical protein
LIEPARGQGSPDGRSRLIKIHERAGATISAAPPVWVFAVYCLCRSRRVGEAVVGMGPVPGRLQRTPEKMYVAV